MIHCLEVKIVSADSRLGDTVEYEREYDLSNGALLALLALFGFFFV